MEEKELEGEEEEEELEGEKESPNTNLTNVLSRHVYRSSHRSVSFPISQPIDPRLWVATN